MTNATSSIERAASGARLNDEDARRLVEQEAISPLLEAAGALRDLGHGDLVSYSPKVFIPLTKLCRDVCHYCTFARPPRNGEAAYLNLDEVLDIARRGAAAGCHEALFTLGDKPELRFKAARVALESLGHRTTLSYLAQAAKAVRDEVGLLPHLNPGLMSTEELRVLRPFAASSGIMLESASERLCEKGGVHYGSPDKQPSLRLRTIETAGELGIAFTSGILIGIGETRLERIDALLALRATHERHGHIQEIIIQNFKRKAGTAMATAPEPSLDDHLWTIAVARLILGARMNIQAPPNLRTDAMHRLIEAGINDWGGVSPVTLDHVNPEAPWPSLLELEETTAACGKRLVPRLPVYPSFALEPERWLDADMRTPVLRRMDTSGYAREGGWQAGATRAPDTMILHTLSRGPRRRAAPRVEQTLERVFAGDELAQADVVHLFGARGQDFTAVCDAADRLRAEVNGDTVGYVVNRNINYTNVCYFKCRFCAFSKGKTSAELRGAPYDLALEEITRRVEEAWERGAVEVCMQGGIHPNYTGETYLNILTSVKRAVPNMHVHAFSPLEVWQGAKTLGISVTEFLRRLKDAGLGSLPGTAAEILDDDIRDIICADKIRTEQWLEVMESAHTLGLRTTATIMFGHVETAEHWARHLLRVRALQVRTGGFTEFVPLPFVAMEAPIYRRGGARAGPTFREAVLMHAVSRLVLHPHIKNVQASWVKLGPVGATACLRAGANDLGGTLMNESITRAAGAAHGQELAPAEMERLIHDAGRVARQRTTLYEDANPTRREAAFAAHELTTIQNTAIRGGRTRGSDLVRFGVD